MTDNKKDFSEKYYLDTQRRLIGSLLVEGVDSDQIISIVSEEDFSDPSMSKIFSSMAHLTRIEEPISPYSVAADLESKGLLGSVGGVSEIEQLYYNGEKWITELPPKNYASIVKDGSVKKAVTEKTEEAKDSFKYDSGVSAREGIEQLNRDLNETLYSISDNTTITKVNQDVDKYLKVIQERERIYEENKDSNDGLQGIPSNIDSLNNYTTGWLPGQLITVAARTGVGKTVMAVNSAVSAARANKSVMFFSLEMGAQEIQDRIYSSTSSVPMKELKQGTLSEESKEWLKDSLEEFKNLKITIDTDPEVTIDNIRAKAIKQAQSEEGLDFIIVDYLQLITPSGRHNSRQEAVADLSRQAKLLAKQLEVPIMVLAQVNRKDKDAEDDRPRLDDIRESHAIAQDSDIVILLHRDTKSEEPDPKTYMFLEKNRNGESNKAITCRSDLACSKFEEIRRATGMSDEDFADSLSEKDVENSIAQSEDMFDEFEAKAFGNDAFEAGNNEQPPQETSSRDKYNDEDLDVFDEDDFSNDGLGGLNFE